jgi:hypothetical protein
MAITLTDARRLVGISPDERGWDAAARGTHELTWDPDAPLLTVVGGSILVDATGTARAHARGADLELASTGRLLAAHGDGVVEVYEPTGAVVRREPAARVQWRPATEELLFADADRVRRVAADAVDLVVDGERGELLVAASPAGTLFAVHGQTGPFDVVDETGQRLGSFPAHDRRNLTATIGATLLATAGADGRVVLYDIVRFGSHLVLDLDALAVRLEFDPTERFLAVTTANDGIHVFDAQAGERVGPTASAAWARWNPSVSCVVCCGGGAMWLEDYD